MDILLLLVEVYGVLQTSRKVVCTWCNVCDNGRQTKSSDPDAEARSLRMIMCLTDALIRLNRCIKLTTHGSQAFRWVVSTSFSTTTWITEICVKTGCQRISQTVKNLVVLDSVLYVWHATRINEILFSSALLKRRNMSLITRRPETRSNHELEKPFNSLGKLQSLRKICLLGPRRRLSEGRDSVFGIATRYGLDGPGMEYRWWRYFSFLSRTTLESTQPPVK